MANANTAEVDRHVAWVRQDRGPTPQRSLHTDGTAECVMLAYGVMLTLLCGEDEGEWENGTWFWGCDAAGRDVLEFTVLRGADPTDEQRAQVVAHVRAMGTNLPHRLDQEVLTW